MLRALMMLILLVLPLPAGADQAASGPAPAPAPAPAVRVPDFPPGEVAVRAYLDPPKVQLGQRFHLVVDVRHPMGHRVELPESVAWEKLESAGSVEHSVTSAATSGAESTVETFRFPLQAFTLDALSTPTMQLTIPGLTVDATRLMVPPLELDVQRALPNDGKTQPAPLSPPLVLLKEDPRFLAWPPLLLAHGLLWLLVRWLDKRRPAAAQHQVLTPVVVIPPHVVALEKLTALRQSTMVEKGATREFVDAVVQVVREYLEAAYHVPVLEQTTPEAIHALGPAAVKSAMDLDHRRLGKLDLNQVRGLLDLADVVKFAKAPASVADCARALDEAVQIIETTRPVGPQASEPTIRMEPKQEQGSEVPS